MRPWAVVLAKSFAGAKTRLGSLAPSQRGDLARSMLEHVLATLECSDTLAGIAVATDGDDVAAVARRRRALVLSDPPNPPGLGLGAIVDSALAHLATLAAPGARGAVVIMADLPLLAPGDISCLIAAMNDHAVVIAPDRHDRGTNALGLSPVSCMATCFGHEDSFRRHLQRARERGLDVAIERSRGLGLDIDLPDHYRELQSLGAAADW